MLRSTLIILLFFYSHISFSQNWTLFPKNQLNHYLISNELNSIRSCLCDSVRTTDTSDIHYFTKYTGSRKKCYWQSNGLFNWVSDEYKFDSLLYCNDSIVCRFSFSGNDYEFIFKHNAIPGDTWKFYTGEELSATCVSTGTAQILGITDSVKTYSLETVSHDDVVFKLSKNYGLVEFISFFDLIAVYPLNNEYYTPVNNLIGYSTDVDTTGFYLPEFSDYFHLSAGDELFWEHDDFYETGWITYYYRDSIIISDIYPDLVVYQIQRKTFDTNNYYISTENKKIKYFREYYEYLFKTPAKWLASDEKESGDIYFTYDINLNISGSDTTILTDYRSTDCMLLPGSDNCDIVCLDGYYGYNYKLSTKEGLTTRKGPYDKRLELLGSVINGKQNGIMEPPVGINSPSKEKDLQIFPNPASDIIQIDHNTTGSYIIRLYDALGNLVMSQKNLNILDISDLPAGYFTIILETANGKKSSESIIILR